MQDAMLSVWRSHVNFPTTGQAVNYMHAVANGTIHEYYSRRDALKRPKEAYMSEEHHTTIMQRASNPSTNPARVVEARDTVGQLLPKLTPDIRASVIMVSQGYKQREVAERLGVCRAMVGKNIEQARAILAKQLTERE